MESLSLHLKDIIINGDNNKSILEIPELKIGKSEIIGIQGPSGAGKSTFLHLLTGLLKPVKGSIKWGDTDIAQFSEIQRDSFRRKYFGLVFQTSFLFEELTPFENICISAHFSSSKDRNNIKKNAKEYLRYFNLLELSNGRSVASFSGGERQRIAVSRALVTDPAIIIADEPTAALDEENANKLIDDLCRVALEKKKTLITVSHDQSVLDKMDRVLTIVNGRISESKRFFQ